MSVPCPPVDLTLPDGRVMLVSSIEDGLIISGGDPQTITSVSSLPWVSYDPHRPGASWPGTSAVNHSRYLKVGKYFQCQICYVFNAAPTFDGGTFIFDPPAGMSFFPDTLNANMVCSEPAYWAALDSSATTWVEGQVCYNSDVTGMILRTGDDLGTSNVVLGSTSIPWATGDKILASAVAELL